MNSFCEIDLSRMTQEPKCAVICRTIDDLYVFFENAQQQLGQFVRWSRDKAVLLWGSYKEKTGFTLFTRTGPDLMTYCNEEWFRENGYEIIEVSDLISILDIDESDVSVYFLFGGVE